MKRLLALALFLALSATAFAQIAPPPLVLHGQPGQAAGPLDAQGMVPASQLPAGALDYVGDWNATTNIPALANGAGTAGQVYVVGVSGTQNLGGGDVNYAVGDMLIYDGAEWDHYAGGSVAVPTGSNPTGSVGTSAVNGVATTFMRSDAAPALNLGIVPDWAGIHTFNGSTSSSTASIILGNSAPELRYFNTSSPVNQKYWRFRSNTSGALQLQSASDASNGGGGGAQTVLGFSRTGIYTDLAQIGTTSQASPFVYPLTLTNTDATLWSTYVPTNPKSLATKDYVDAIAPRIVASAGQAAQGANINAPTLYAVPASGMYRASCYVVISRAATTSSTMPSCNVTYTEATTGVAVSDIVTQSANLNQVGAHTGGTSLIQAQSGSNIGYTTGGYASSGATTMQYAVNVKVEALQ